MTWFFNGLSIIISLMCEVSFWSGCKRCKGVTSIQSLMYTNREGWQTARVRLFKNKPQNAFQVLVEVVKNRIPTPLDSLAFFQLKSIKFSLCVIGECTRENWFCSLISTFSTDGDISSNCFLECKRNNNNLPQTPPSPTHCIPRSKVCDLSRDCFGGEDESFNCGQYLSLHFDSFFRVTSHSRQSMKRIVSTFLL